MDHQAAFARRVVERRAPIAHSILEQLGYQPSGRASSFLLRSLASVLGHAIESSSPERVVEWAGTARGGCSVAVLRKLIEKGCAAAAIAGETLDLDVSALLVFLEVVKLRVEESLATVSVSDSAFRPASEIVDSIVAMLKARDEATCSHSRETGELCRRLAATLNVPSPQAVFVANAGILHDIGKLAIPDAILFKPGPLTGLEWSVMRKHPEIGARILSGLPTLSRFASIVRAHHERWDGKGYPLKLKADQIPFAARIIAVADTFHALTSNRPYRTATGQPEALSILREGRGTQWDPRVVDAMATILDTRRDTDPRESAPA